ncbi:hypothetical protein OPQ81_003873 [Rhizoctonia solani]|nr:hypothetical protein OPQ81_003873 [Rhizoctonia solani]
MPIPNNRPMVLCGNFNMHHPKWALAGSKWEKHCLKPYEQDFYEFTKDNDLYLANEFTTPTCIHPNCPQSNSIIDLMFLNSQAANAWPNFNFDVESQDSEHNVGSDHMAVTWTLTLFTPPNQDKPDDLGTGDKTSHVIDPALHEDWVSGFSHALEQEDLPSDPITAKDADQYVGAILSAMSSTTRQVMPECKKKGKGPAWSPWWTDKCSEALHRLKHRSGHETRDQLQAALQGVIQRAWRNHADQICAEVMAQMVFETTRWFTGKCCALLPPIKSPNDGSIATHPIQKAKNFAHQFFCNSSSPNISLEPLGVLSHPKHPFQPITTEEIIASLKQTSNHSAPGAFGTNYCLLKWAFYLHPDIFTWLFNCCLWIGYHPTCLHNTVISPIPKPHCTNMSHPKNYRPIALLKTLSKLLEKVITKHLIHEAGAHNLIPHSQFGGHNMTSCTNAGLCMTHNICMCWAQKKEVMLLTLDVLGYFNNVDHACLIYTLDRLGYLDQICNWLQSYLTSHTAQFHVDGTLCLQLQLPSVSVPQGSPLSPILSSLYSIPPSGCLIQPSSTLIHIY